MDLLMVLAAWFAGGWALFLAWSGLCVFVQWCDKDNLVRQAQRQRSLTFAWPMPDNDPSPKSRYPRLYDQDAE